MLCVKNAAIKCLNKHILDVGNVVDGHITLVDDDKADKAEDDDDVSVDVSGVQSMMSNVSIVADAGKDEEKDNAPQELSITRQVNQPASKPGSTDPHSSPQSIADDASVFSSSSSSHPSDDEVLATPVAK